MHMKVTLISLLLIAVLSFSVVGVAATPTHSGYNHDLRGYNANVRIVNLARFPPNVAPTSIYWLVKSDYGRTVWFAPKADFYDQNGKFLGTVVAGYYWTGSAVVPTYKYLNWGFVAIPAGSYMYFIAENVLNANTPYRAAVNGLVWDPQGGSSGWSYLSDTPTQPTFSV